MAIFVNLQHYARFLGFLLFNRPHARAISIFLRVLVVFGVGGIIVTTTAFLIWEENDIHDKSQCISSIFAISFVIWVVVYFSYYKQHILEAVASIDRKIKVAERRADATIYQKTNAEFEDFTAKMIIFVNGVLVIGTATIPVIITAYYNYYVKDMGEASFSGEPSK